MADGEDTVAAVLAGFSIAQQEIVVWREPMTVELRLQPGSLAEEVTVIGARLAGSERCCGACRARSTC